MTTVEAWQMDRAKRKEPAEHRPRGTRQRQILMCRCWHGLTISETAQQIGIADRTVQNISTSILKTLGVHTMAQVCCRFGRMLGPEHGKETTDG